MNGMEGTELVDDAGRHSSLMQQGDGSKEAVLTLTQRQEAQVRTLLFSGLLPRLKLNLPTLYPPGPGSPCLFCRHMPPVRQPFVAAGAVSGHCEIGMWPAQSQV